MNPDLESVQLSDSAPTNPGPLSQALNIARSAVHGVKSVAKTELLGWDRASSEDYEARLNTCRNCPGGHATLNDRGDVHSCGPMLEGMATSTTDGAHKPCGCLIKRKARDAAEACPMGYWPTVKATERVLPGCSTPTFKKKGCGCTKRAGSGPVTVPADPALWSMSRRRFVQGIMATLAVTSISDILVADSRKRECYIKITPYTPGGATAGSGQWVRCDLVQGRVLSEVFKGDDDKCYSIAATLPESTKPSSSALVRPDSWPGCSSSDTSDGACPECSEGEYFVLTECEGSGSMNAAEATNANLTTLVGQYVKIGGTCYKVSFSTTMTTATVTIDNSGGSNETFECCADCADKKIELTVCGGSTKRYVTCESVTLPDVGNCGSLEKASVVQVGGTCYTVGGEVTQPGPPEELTIEAFLPSCDDCNSELIKLASCQGGRTIVSTPDMAGLPPEEDQQASANRYNFLTSDPNKVWFYDGTCWKITPATTGCPEPVSLSPIDSCEEPECKMYTLVACEGGGRIVTDSDMSTYIGRVVDVDGDCYEVQERGEGQTEAVSVDEDFADCDECELAPCECPDDVAGSYAVAASFVYGLGSNTKNYDVDATVSIGSTPCNWQTVAQATESGGSPSSNTLNISVSLRLRENSPGDCEWVIAVDDLASTASATKPRGADPIGGYSPEGGGASVREITSASVS